MDVSNVVGGSEFHVNLLGVDDAFRADGWDIRSDCAGHDEKEIGSGGKNWRNSFSERTEFGELRVSTRWIQRRCSHFGAALTRQLTRPPGTPEILIGTDTRESGGWIAELVAGGLEGSKGARVRFAGVITTPGVAYLTRTGPFTAGVMISASRDPVSRTMASRYSDTAASSCVRIP